MLRVLHPYIPPRDSTSRHTRGHYLPGVDLFLGSAVCGQAGQTDATNIVQKFRDNFWIAAKPKGKGGLHWYAKNSAHDSSGK